MRRISRLKLVVGVALALWVAAGCSDLEQSDLTDGVGAVEGVVLAEDGSPLVGAHVLVEGNLELYTRSGDDGTFRIENVPAGRSRLISYTPGGLGAALDVTVLAGETTPASMSLAPTATISGAVTLAGADDHVGTLAYLLGTSFAAYTDHAGEFTMFFVVPGCYTLRAEHDGYAAKEVGPICVEAGEAKSIDEFTLVASASSGCSADDECPAGQSCVDGACAFREGFTAEVCDGADNDGDGLVDEGLVELCGSSVGVCEPGVSLCLGGLASPCFGQIGPGEEDCSNGLDDDCDGETDEGCCVPNCDGRVCGDDGCGGSCGTCDDGCYFCAEERGECAPIPCDTECESDADCGTGERCEEPTPGCCGECVPADCVAEGGWFGWDEELQCCDGLQQLTTSDGVAEGECAPLDCGIYNVCTRCGDGECGIGENFCTCPADCQETCVGEGGIVVGRGGCCDGLDSLPMEDETGCPLNVCTDCGDGSCSFGETADNCPADCCVPDCDGRVCGDDGCGGSCGTCDDGCYFCDETRGECAPIPCATECESDDDCGEGMRCEEPTPGCCGMCVADDCVREGGWFGWGEELQCCDGLQQLTTSDGVFEGECAPLDCGIYNVCTRCGDGECGIGESFCTCPADCRETCVGEGGIVVGAGGCCEGLDSLPMEDETGCPLNVCTDCGNGSCDFGETGESCPADCCVPDCDGRECGDDGCGGTCGSCPDGCSCFDGMCDGGSSTETLTPDCVHVPPVVVAGQPVALAVYGNTTGCTSFTHAVAALEGDTVTLTAHASTSTCGPCPACLWTYAGMATVTFPTPGEYKVVAGGVEYSILASGGGIAGPNCDDACVDLGGEEAWMLSFFTTFEFNSSCGGDLFEASTFSGECQHYTLETGDDWTASRTVYACTERLLYFDEAPEQTIAPVTGTRCVDFGGVASEVILGVTNQGVDQSQPPEIFVLERF